jgi:hypothetical protein
VDPQGAVLAKADGAQHPVRRSPKKKRSVIHELPKALRALEEAGASGGGCPLEPQFNQLYAVLGDAEAQDKIRAKHANVSHCPKLRHHASACTGCPNNPRESADAIALQERIDACGPLLNRALRLHTLAECGLLNRSDLTSAEIDMLSIAHHEIVTARMRRQAEMIGEVLSKFLAG